MPARGWLPCMWRRRPWQHTQPMVSVGSVQFATKGCLSMPRQAAGGAAVLPLQERLKALKKEYGSKVLGQCTVNQAIGGMRSIPVRPCVWSLLHAAGRGPRPGVPPLQCARLRPPSSLLTELRLAAGCTQGMLWETSLLDAEEGIRFRGYSIPELQVGSAVWVCERAAWAVTIVLVCVV